MKYIITCAFLFIYSCISAQKIDTTIDNGVYQSFFNYKLKTPVFVRYKLSNGGGDCSRESFRFNNDTKIKTATLKDYAHSGYDIGHMCNAEDEAFDCTRDESTFRFYNALPQTPNLNRGIWKKDETSIRALSKNDTLLILCGGFFTKDITIGDKVAVPTECWKMVYSYKQKKIVFCKAYTNEQIGATSRDINPAYITAALKVNIVLYLNYLYK